MICDRKKYICDKKSQFVTEKSITQKKVLSKINSMLLVAFFAIRKKVDSSFGKKNKKKQGRQKRKKI